jgi:hypothetical protein
VTSDTALPSAATRTDSDAARAALSGLGYPLRTVVTLSTALALAVIGWVLPVDRGVMWGWVAIVVALSVLILWLHARRLSRARERNVHVIAQLGAATADLPVALRTRMPLALVTGDGLSALFDRDTERSRFVHVGDGAIWLRADHPQDLARLAVAVRQWRDGHAPDCVVLSVAPGLHANDDTLSQSLRVIRQAVADASRMLGTSRIPRRCRRPGGMACRRDRQSSICTASTPQSTQPNRMPSMPMEIRRLRHALPESLRWSDGPDASCSTR